MFEVENRREKAVENNSKLISDLNSSSPKTPTMWSQYEPDWKKRLSRNKNLNKFEILNYDFKKFKINF